MDVQYSNALAFWASSFSVLLSDCSPKALLIFCEHWLIAVVVLVRAIWLLLNSELKVDGNWYNFLCKSVNNNPIFKWRCEGFMVYDGNPAKLLPFLATSVKLEHIFLNKACPLNFPSFSDQIRSIVAVWFAKTIHWFWYASKGESASVLPSWITFCGNLSVIQRIIVWIEVSAVNCPSILNLSVTWTSSSSSVKYSPISSMRPV